MLKTEDWLMSTSNRQECTGQQVNLSDAVPPSIPTPISVPLDGPEMPEGARFLCGIKPCRSGSQHRWGISKLQGLLKPHIEGWGRYSRWRCKVGGRKEGPPRAFRPLWPLDFGFNWSELRSHGRVLNKAVMWHNLFVKEMTLTSELKIDVRAMRAKTGRWGQEALEIIQEWDEGDWRQDGRSEGKGIAYTLGIFSS